MIEFWRALLIGLSVALFLCGVQLNKDEGIFAILIFCSITLALAKFKEEE
jgi:hypothetical protein